MLVFTLQLGGLLLALALTTASLCYHTHNIIILPMIFTIFFASLMYSRWRYLQAYIPGIPVIPDDSLFFGFTRGMSFWNHKDAHLVLKRAAEHFGHIFQFHFCGQLVVCVSDSVMARHILKNVHGKGFFHRGDPMVTPSNIFNLDTNTEWQRRRTMFRQPFSLSVSKSYTPVVRDFVLKLCSKLEDASIKGQPVKLDRLFGQLAMDVICKVGFNYELHALDESDEYQELHTSLRKGFENSWVNLIPGIGYLLMLPFSFGFLGANKNAKLRIKMFAQKLFQHVLSIDDWDPNSLGYAIKSFAELTDITEEEVLAEISLLFVAGHETTAHTLSWAFYALCRDSKLQDMAREAATNFDDSSNTLDTLPPILEAIIKESMRKYTILGIGSMRLVRENEGYKYILHDREVTFPKGTWFLVNIHTLHNSKDFWGPNAENFDPTRWLPESHETIDQEEKIESFKENLLSKPNIFGGGSKELNELCFAPFSCGPRNCLGMNLALLEVRLGLCELAKRFSFCLYDEAMFDEEYAMDLHLTLRPKDDLEVRVHKYADI